MDALINAGEDELTLVDEIGPIMAKAIVNFFAEDQNIAFINRLREAGVAMDIVENSTQDERFAGMTFVLTGTLEKYTRNEASAIIENLGGKTSSSVLKKQAMYLQAKKPQQA